MAYVTATGNLSFKMVNLGRAIFYLLSYSNVVKLHPEVLERLANLDINSIKFVHGTAI